MSLTFKCAIFKWVSSVSVWTRAKDIIMFYSTFSIRSTLVGTRIFTLHIDANFVIWTVRAEETLRFTRAERVSNIVTHTFTDCSSIQYKTLGIFSAWWWVARISRRSWVDLNLITSNKWISSKTCSAVTNWVVGVHWTLGVNTASSNTWVNTLVAGTS